LKACREEHIISPQEIQTMKERNDLNKMIAKVIIVLPGTLVTHGIACAG
jgi:hypothetical protein